jgi:hypothetical protein
VFAGTDNRWKLTSKAARAEATSLADAAARG